LSSGEEGTFDEAAERRGSKCCRCAAGVLIYFDESYDAFDGLRREREERSDEERGERGRRWEEGRACRAV
jgi:hypothetical protein